MGYLHIMVSTRDNRASHRSSNISLFVVFSDQQGIAGRSLSIHLSILTWLYVPFARGTPYMMAHASVTYAANEWMKELAKKR